MSNAATDQADIVAFNACLTLSGNDLQALAQSEWTLHALFRKGSSTAGLGLLHVLTMQGKRPEAASMADELWGRRASLSAEDRLNLAVLCAAIGSYDRAAGLVDLPERSMSPEYAARRIMLEFEAYVVTWEHAESNFIRQLSPEFAAWRDELAEIGLLAHMQARQAAVSRVVGPFQCGNLMAMGHDDDDEPALIRTIYVPGTYPERRTLAAEIKAVVADLYDDVGVDGSRARRLLHELVLPVAARPPIAQAALEELM